MRRAKVLEYLSKGLSQTEIAKLLGVDKSTITRDMQELRKQAKEGIKEYIQDVLPLEFKKSIISFDTVIRQAWAIALRNDVDPKVELQALNVISDAVLKRQQILGDISYIERAIKSVAAIRKKMEGRHSQEEHEHEQQEEEQQQSSSYPEEEEGQENKEAPSQ